MPTVKDRVCDLERTLEEYIKNVGNSQMQTERELRALRHEMHEFKEEMREDRKKIYKKWGEIANKMGTVVEDIVAPNIPSIAKQYFHCNEG